MLFFLRGHFEVSGPSSQSLRILPLMHYDKDPKLWELWSTIMGNAGSISSTVVLGGFVEFHQKLTLGPSILLLPTSFKH